MLCSDVVMMKFLCRILCKLKHGFGIVGKSVVGHGKSLPSVLTEHLLHRFGALVL